MTRQLVGEECSPLFGNSTGLAYDVTVRLTPSDVSNPITLDSTSSLEQVARNIRTSFLLGASSDSGWDIQMDVVRVIAQAQGLQTLPGKNTMGLIATLLITTLLFEFGSGRVEERQSCVVVGVLIHFFLVSSFTWMVICTVHMHRIFSNVIASRVDDREGSARVFLIHVIVSVVVPGLVVLSTLLANYYTSDHECVMDLGYGDGICYLSNRLSLILGSILPISLAVVINLVLFALTLHALRKLSRERRDVTQRNHEQFSIYVKLSTLTGINWLVGLVAALVDSEAVWYAFLVLCGLQGVYVFVAFVCNKRVLRLYRGLMCTCCGRGKQSTSSEQRGHGNGWAHSSSDQGLCPGSENTKSSSLMQHTTSENATGKSKAMSNTRL
nr:hypothetical protein BaRGS_022242 [Batillaria attramentaria]